MIAKKRKLKVLFLDILTDNPELRRDIEENLYDGGTYSDHVRMVFGLSKNEWSTLYADKNKFPTKLHKLDSLVIGGSAMNPVKGEHKIWMKNTYKFIRKVINQNIPVFGICGGLEFVVKALGGEVVYNPKGREFGTAKIKIKKSDQLFHGLGKVFQAQENHVCMASKLPQEAKILASSELCSIQGIAIGNKVRLVQFHPERQKHQTQVILREAGHDPARSRESFDKLMKSIRDTSETDKLIINNFLKYFVY